MNPSWAFVVLSFTKRVRRGLNRAMDIAIRMRCAQEHCFKLRGRQINPAIEHDCVEAGEGLRI